MFSRQLYRATNSLTRSTFASRELLSQQRSHVYRVASPALTRYLCTAKDAKDVTSADVLGNKYTPKYQVQPIDKFFLIVTRTMKAGEIPKEVSYEVIEKSQNRRRIMVNAFTIFVTFVGSYIMIRLGRRARDTHSEDTMFEKNVRRYEDLREQDRLKAEAEAAAKTT